MTLRAHIVVFFLLPILMFSGEGHASPRGIVKRGLIRLSRILEMNNPQKRSTGIIQELHRNFDFSGFEDNVLQDVAPQFSPRQRSRFSKAFQDMFERKIIALADDESFRCDNYTVDENTMNSYVVVTCVQSDKTNEITLHFHPKNGRKICDISFSGALLSRNYRGVINKTLRKDGIDSLIQKVEEKSAKSISSKSLL